MWVEDSGRGGRANALHAEQGSHGGHSRKGRFCFEDVCDLVIREHLIQHAHVVASAGLCVSLGVCVGQRASSEGLASKFLMVVISNVRTIAWGGGGGRGRPRKKTGNSSYEMMM